MDIVGYRNRTAQTKTKCIIIDRLSTDILLGTDMLCKDIYKQADVISSYVNSFMTITHHGTHVEWTKVPENFKASDGRVPFILSNKRSYYKIII